MRAALGFLTVLPLRATTPGRGGLVAFPVAGALIGLVWAVAAWGGAVLGGPLVAAGFVLAADLAVTGGLHLDAFADAADGVAARLPAEATRRVLHDPCIGAVGAAALATMLLLRFALLAAAASRLPAPPHAALAVLALPPVAGRAGMVWTLRRLPAGDGSLGADLQRAAAAPVPGLAALVALAAGVAALATVRDSAAALGLAVTILAGVLAAADLAGRWWARRFGFPSGDAVGAVGIVTETAALAALVALL